ncbi:fatty acid desaturase [Cocleimonas flava]|uniref:Stearoyl-CoA desaturase (Delta-9 desaturase) n=1 Tax=Cocleimonas flava TaxID=634765 RepID=A0A4R1F7B6_9GAMM|nr:acyl-CoA desaturase [Cocleimonas flava]TCJ88542.1 stearoyl-CoA desaturase (delta-9 desaturase) [Cocleimonas flava]
MKDQTKLQMKTHKESPRMAENRLTNGEFGQVLWAPAKSLWYTSHLFIAVVGGAYFFSLSALAVFIVFTATTVCLGHSLGMHRRLIHSSYECPKWLEYFFVHLGVLVGMAGPLGMTHQHDLRDWAQRKPRCHAYLRHGSGIIKDAWWQLHCDLKLDHAPEFLPEDDLKQDRIYRFMESTWMLQQLPWAIVLFYFGGVSWVVWGISARIVVSITGHWLVGYFAHNEGERDWHVNGAAVQGHNVRFAGLLTMGESWHNNHHAFPGSAMLGLYQNQSDPGWWVLNRLMNLGLVWNVKLPADLDYREELMPIDQRSQVRGAVKLPQKCPLLSHFQQASS